MSQAQLLIRADAGPAIGTGHVMRMLALAHQWQFEGGEVTILSKCDAPALQLRIQSDGIRLVEAATTHPDPKDLAQTLVLANDLTRKSRYFWLALDGYHFDPSYQQALRAANIKTLVMDDTCLHSEYHADILVNLNAGAQSLAYRTHEGAKRLLGLSYALLRREFLLAPRRPLAARRNPKRILVTMGGADPLNITSAVLEALAKPCAKGLHARVIVGSANRKLEELRNQVASMPGKVDLFADVTDMTTHMHWADLAIAPVSSTCWELLYMNVPFLSVAFADCQHRLKAEFQAKGVPVLDWQSPDAIAKLQTSVAAVLENGVRLFARAATQGIAIDGLGSKRAVTAMLEYDCAAVPQLEQLP